MRITQDSVLVDSRHPARVGCPVTVQFTLANPNSEPMAYCTTSYVSVPISNTPTIFGEQGGTLQPSGSQLITGTFTPSVAGQYNVNISIAWSIGGGATTTFSPPTSSFMVVSSAKDNGHHNNGHYNNGHYNNGQHNNGHHNN